MHNVIVYLLCAASLQFFSNCETHNIPRALLTVLRQAFRQVPNANAINISLAVSKCHAASNKQNGSYETTCGKNLLYGLTPLKRH